MPAGITALPPQAPCGGGARRAAGAAAVITITASFFIGTARFPGAGQHAPHFFELLQLF